MRDSGFVSSNHTYSEECVTKSSDAYHFHFTNIYACSLQFDHIIDSKSQSIDREKACLQVAENAMIGSGFHSVIDIMIHVRCHFLADVAFSCLLQ